MEPNNLQLSSTSDSESETREVMLTEEAATSNQHPVYTTATIKKNKSTQVWNQKRSTGVQAVRINKNKTMQTFKLKLSLHSVAIQTDNTSLKENTLGTKLQKELHSRTDFKKFAQKLNDYEQTEKFVKCISALSKGSLAFTNMAWKSFLRNGILVIMQFNHKNGI